MNPARNCPVCRGGEAALLADLGALVPESLDRQRSLSVLACEACGFVYQDGDATSSDYEDYYGHGSSYDTSPTIAEETEVLFQAYRDSFLRLVPREATVVDVGCAGGIFLSHLKGAGYRGLVGVDPSPACVGRVRDRGIEAHVGSIYADPPETLRRRFDLVVLSGVMEHLFDPHRALDQAVRYLRGAGMLFISVPDASRYDAYPNALSYYFNFEHINHFSPASLESLMARNGFESVETRAQVVRLGEAPVPIVAAFFRKGTGFRTNLLRDADTRAGVTRYLEVSRAARERELLAIRVLRERRTELMIWGAGNVATELLAGTELKYCAIRGFVDRDRGKQGKTLGGITIYAPEVLRGFTGTIVICSAIYSGAIMEEIKSMDLGCDVVVLR